MTPKEKAIELVNSCNDLAKDFTRGVSMNEFSKQLALIAVDEILNYDNQFIQTEEQFNYWKEVKSEIEKL